MRTAVALVLVVAAVAALGLVPVLAPPFYANLLVPFYGYAIALLGFNLLFGYGGLLSFGHAMFLGLGAYGAAVITGVLGHQRVRNRSDRRGARRIRGGTSARMARGALHRHLLRQYSSSRWAFWRTRCCSSSIT